MLASQTLTTLSLGYWAAEEAAYGIPKSNPIGSRELEFWVQGFEMTFTFRRANTEDTAEILVEESEEFEFGKMTGFWRL